MKNHLKEKKKSNFYHELYSWATLALSHPDDDRLLPDTVKILEGLQSSPDHNMNFKVQLENMKICEQNEEINLLALKKEHSMLFIGPFSLLAPPYESYHRDHGMVMGESSKEVEQFYALGGMEIAPEFKDAPDHIILEVDFLARLCEKEQSAWAAKEPEKASYYRELMKKFLEEHLLTWIDMLQIAVERGARYEFYPAVLQVLSNVTKNRYRELEKAFN